MNRGDKNVASLDDTPNSKNEEIISKIPQIFLNANVVNGALGIVDPFFLSLMINGKLLKNCMIDSGASNTVMPAKIMKSLGIKVDTPHGRCQAMDSREVPVIGTIKAFPYKLAAFPDKQLTMSVLVVDIPPQHGMLLSRKWSASMGGSIQCDLSFATFNIEGDSVKVSREARTPHMIEEDEDDNMNCFVDTNIGSFQVQEKEVQEKVKLVLLVDDENNMVGGNVLWTLYFDGASSKEGARAGVLLISPSGKTFKFYFTLLFLYTNNVAEYEALLIGLRQASKHGIKYLRVIGDSKLIISQIRSKYASKNQRLKQYRNSVWDEIEGFNAFGIDWVDRSQNKMAKLLENIALRPEDITFVGISKSECKSRPYIPDNVENCQIFSDDQDILRFLQCDSHFDG